MWISELRVRNVKSFADSGPIQLSKGINVVVGKNNAGKSTLLQSVLCMQSTNQQHPFIQLADAVRIGTSEAAINLHLKDINDAHFNANNTNDGRNVKKFSNGEEGDLIISFSAISQPLVLTFITKGTKNAVNSYTMTTTHREPNEFILPYTVRRFSQGFNPLMSNNPSQPKYVLELLAQLAEKIQPFTQSTHSLHDQFDKLCQGLIGSPMGIIEGANGHLPGIYTNHDGSIPLSQMGDGVPHIIGLIIHLLKAEKRLFVIEELESGINPEPLKLLLEEIKRSAKERQNQFIISTHSNIVLQSLASEKDCTIIEVSQIHNQRGGIPESFCIQIEGNDVEARRHVLTNLGYSLADSDMFDGWLILEEASAETIIRKFLIPQFAPKLANVLGIIATKGYQRVESQVTALEQNFLYLHLTSVYKERIWAIIDGGENEKQVIESLQKKFKSWSPEHFDQFNEHDFEKYYPSCFQDDVEVISNIAGNNRDSRKLKQDKKKELLNKLMKWIDEDMVRAKREFEFSAQEVINKLRKIESQLSGKTNLYI